MYYILFIKFKLSASNNSQVHKYKKTTCENETEKCRIYLFTVLRSVDLPSLWNVIITDVAGRSAGYCWYRHLP